MKTNTSVQESREAIADSSCGRRSGLHHRILLAADFSPACQRVFEEALQAAKDTGSELLIAHADAIPAAFSYMPAANYDAWTSRCLTDCKQRIRCFVETAHQEGVRCHALALTGFADDAVIEAARRLKVDLIVVGTHQRRGWSRLFAGSVAARMISRAPCSVLAVRLPA